MLVEFEPMDDFEQELRQAFERRPAPPSLKRKIMARRSPSRPQSHAVWWQRLAASVVLAAMVGGGVLWRQAEGRRKGELAREQVLTALRITNHALNEMNARLAARGRAQE
jgi:hypothetical protein